MSIAVFDHMELCTPAEVARMLPLVSPQRREQALQYKHVFGQFACLKSWLMLQQLLAERGITGDLFFEYNKYGKPRLRGIPVDFSISHCKRAIGVAVSEQAIGFDIEAIRHPSPSLVQKTMNEQEQQQIAQSADPDTAFTALWTRKEAILKWRGTGIVDDLHGVLADVGENEIQTNQNIEKGYIFSVFSKTIG